MVEILTSEALNNFLKVQSDTNSRQLQTCSSNCQSCTFNDECDVCNSGYYLWHDGCISPCPSYTVQVAGVCNGNLISLNMTYFLLKHAHIVVLHAPILQHALHVKVEPSW